MPRQLVATAEQVRDLNRRLAEFVSRASAAAVFLLDESGALIAQQGRGPAGEPAEVATLMACNFLVTHELAKYLGDREIQVLLHEGDKQSFYFRRAGARGVLVVLYDDPGALGRVRALAERAGAEFGLAVDALDAAGLPAGALPEGFAAEAEGLLDQVLWSSEATAIRSADPPED